MKNRKHPKRRILVKHLLRHGQVWFINRYGYKTWQDVAADLNHRKDIRLGGALYDDSIRYEAKIVGLRVQLSVHKAMGDTIVIPIIRERLRDANYEYTKYRSRRYDIIQKKLTEYDYFRRYGWDY